MSKVDRVYNVWVLAHPCQDVPGQWVAHCLEFDVVSQGNSLEHAMRMVGEACALVVVDDLTKGKDPLARRAPEKCFDEMFEALQTGNRVPMDIALADSTGKYSYAIQMELRATKTTKARKASSPTHRAPVAFAQAVAC